MGKAVLHNLLEKLAKGTVFGLPDFLGHVKNFDPFKQDRMPRKIMEKLNGRLRYRSVRIADLPLCGYDDREKLQVIKCE